MQWLLIVLGIILAVVGVFALQNPAVVTLHFLNLSTEASVLVVILLAYAAGVFSGVLALLPSSMRKSRRLRKASSELRALHDREAARAAGPGPLREAVAAADRSARAERVDTPAREGSVEGVLGRTVVSPQGVPASDSSAGSPAHSSEDPPDGSTSAEPKPSRSKPSEPKPGRLGGFFRS